MNDPDFKPRKLPGLPRFIRPIFVTLACLALAAGVGTLIWAFIAAPRGILVH